MSDAIEWLAVASPISSDAVPAALRTAIESAIESELAGTTAAQDVLGDTARRRVFRAATPDGVVAVKRHQPVAAARLRDALRRPVLGSSARREWRAQNAAADALRGAAGAPALPQPIALIRARSAEFVVSRYIEATPLLDVLEAAAPPERRNLLEQLGRAMRVLSTARVAHGDLHLGNVLLSNGRPVFVDWQRARVDASRAALARDLADLEFSLARSGTRRADRMRLRRSTLGEPGGPPQRRSLRDAGSLADDVAHDHYRGRTRRSLVAGRRFANVGAAIGRGMRLAQLPDRSVADVIAAHDRALRHEPDAGSVLKDDERARVTRVPMTALAGWDALDAFGEEHGRSWIVKEVAKSGIGRQLADPFRGSPARRGWLGGHGLLARGLEAVQPLAFVELNARRSLLVLEDASPGVCLDDETTSTWQDTSEDALANAILKLLLALHRRGVHHGDLQASHLFAEAEGGSVSDFTLIDLEGVRFARKLSDDARLRALAELNASLAEARLSGAARLRIFECYARALPFAMAREEALRQAIERSKARRHRWSGSGGPATSD